MASPDKIKADIARLTDELAAAVQAEDYAKADPLKRELDGLKSVLKDLPASTAPAKAASTAPAFGGFGAPAAPVASAAAFGGFGAAPAAPAAPAAAFGGFGAPAAPAAPAPTFGGFGGFGAALAAAPAAAFGGFGAPAAPVAPAAAFGGFGGAPDSAAGGFSMGAQAPDAGRTAFQKRQDVKDAVKRRVAWQMQPVTAKAEELHGKSTW